MFKRKIMALSTLVLVSVTGVSGCGLTELNTGFSSAEDTTSAETEIPAVSAGEEETVPDELNTDSAAGDEEETAYSVVSGQRYAYETLNDTEKAVYEEIVAAFMDRTEQAAISTTDIGEMERAYLAVRCDYSGFFWVGEFKYVTYTRGDEVISIDIQPEYVMSEEEQEDIQQRIDAEADRMLADAPAQGSDFDKALYVYETLIREVDYDVNAADGQTIISTFLNHETVCQGYAYATQYLLRQFGIPCMTVFGSADGEAHAWNLAFLDGAYYYIDTTWGNSQFVYRDEEMEEYLPAKFINYDYFGMTTEMMLREHQPDEEIPLPDCEATTDNYYIHEGLYIDTWDPDRIGQIIQQGYQNGDDMVRIRFSDRELYEQAEQYFLTENRIFRYCEGLRSVHFLQGLGDEVLVIVFK